MDVEARAREVLQMARKGKRIADLTKNSNDMLHIYRVSNYVVLDGYNRAAVLELKGGDEADECVSRALAIAKAFDYRLFPLDAFIELCCGLCRPLKEAEVTVERTVVKYVKV